jgi:hypothetical protein
MRIQRRGGDLKKQDPNVSNLGKMKGQRRMKRLQRSMDSVRPQPPLFQGYLARQPLHQPFYKANRYFERNKAWMKAPPPVSVSYSSIPEDVLALNHPTHYAQVDNRQAYLAQQALEAAQRQLQTQGKSSTKLSSIYRQHLAKKGLRKLKREQLADFIKQVLATKNFPKSGSGSTPTKSPGGLNVAQPASPVQPFSANPANLYTPVKGKSGKGKGLPVSNNLQTEDDVYNEIGRLRAGFDQLSHLDKYAAQISLEYLNNQLGQMQTAAGGGANP